MVGGKHQAVASSGSAPSIWASLGRSAGARLLVLPVSAILGIVCTRLILDNYGPAVYAQYGLLVGLGALLPFADLGISAAIMNAVAGSDDPSSDRHVRAILVTSIRIATGSAVVLVLISLGITILGAWPTLLGAGLLPDSGPLAAAICLGLIGAAIPFGIGQRLLVGLGKNHVSIVLLGLQTPVVLLILVLMIRFDVPGGVLLAVIPYAITLLLSGLCLVVAGRQVKPLVATSLRGAPRVRSVRGGRVFDTAWPMLIQMIALPIAMQSDRLVLSHISGVPELAEYNLASQMYSPVWQVTSAAGLALWPIFARARARNDNSASPLRLSLAFAGAAAVVCLVISAVSPWLAQVASGGRISIDVPMMLAFSALMIVQSAKYPLGMYMTDSKGLRYQAYSILLMVPVNLGLSILLATRLGAVGPVVGSFIGVLLFQLLANMLYVRRERARRIAVDAATSDGPDLAPVDHDAAGSR